MKVVFDTNTLFAAFVARTGVCAKVIEASLAEHDVFLSWYILDELRRNLSIKLNIEKSRIDEAIQSLLDGAKVVEPSPVPDTASRDPKDAPVLGTAIAAHAEVLVTGDKDLLVLGIYESIPIISPRQFHDRFISAQ